MTAGSYGMITDGCEHISKRQRFPVRRHEGAAAAINRGGPLQRLVLGFFVGLASWKASVVKKRFYLLWPSKH
jgi:hypothetical protein